MTDRRITEDRHTPKLKQIAGLICGLSYREMNELSELLQKHKQVSADAGYQEALLKVADEILVTPAPADLCPGLRLR